ncbi:MAG: nucleotide exchange factor GrpE [Bacteroidales bacterium]
MKDKEIKNQNDRSNQKNEVKKESAEVKEEFTEVKKELRQDDDIEKDIKEQTAEDKIENLGNKLQEVNDKYLRLYSEFENYRKRTSKERIDIISNASEQIIKELLPVVDDFDRALNAMNNIENEQLQQTLAGVSLIYKKLYSILETKGLKPINAKGEVFDENLHEAIAQIPATNEEEKGKIIDETTKGYYLNDKVIRYSKVVVAM